MEIFNNILKINPDKFLRYNQNIFETIHILKHPAHPQIFYGRTTKYNAKNIQVQQRAKEKEMLAWSYSQK